MEKGSDIKSTLQYTVKKWYYKLNTVEKTGVIIFEFVIWWQISLVINSQ
jgi:hypothetical protein